MTIFGRDRTDARAPGQLTDEQALARYRYMLETAPPEDIERAHEEAFAQLTPEQRRQALEALAQHVPATEIRGDDPASLARTATRAEMRQPGTIERAWGGSGGPGLGGMFLSTLAGAFVGTAIADAFFGADAAGASGADTAGADQPADDSDAAEGDTTGGEFGGDLGGGDLGDLGGGDFGGGDFGGF
jgi:hypothetical protein